MKCLVSLFLLKEFYYVVWVLTVFENLNILNRFSVLINDTETKPRNKCFCLTIVLFYAEKNLKDDIKFNYFVIFVDVVCE